MATKPSKLIEFPKKDIITQKELEPICLIETQLDLVLGELYQRREAGATIEDGPLTLRMRHRPARAIVADRHQAG